MSGRRPRGGSVKLFMVHCGFYDAEVGDGLYESHVNLFVAAESFEEARLRAKALEEFRSKRMHVDGLLEISSVGGFAVEMREDLSLLGQNGLISQKHRDLAPKAGAAPGSGG